MLDLWMKQTFNLSLGQSILLLCLCLFLVFLVAWVDEGEVD